MINGESMPGLGKLNVVLEGLSPEEQVKVMLEALAKTEAEKAELQFKEDERLRIANLKGIIARHDYGGKATELLIMRNMTEEKKDELAPPAVLVNFLTVYDLKLADGNSRICVSTKDLDKCHKLLGEGKALEEITLEDIAEKNNTKKIIVTPIDDSAVKKVSATSEENNTTEVSDMAEPTDKQEAKPEAEPESEGAPVAEPVLVPEVVDGPIE